MQVIQLVNVADIHFLFIQLSFVEVLKKGTNSGYEVPALKRFTALSFKVVLVAMNGFKPRRLGEEEQNAGNHFSARLSIIALSSEKTLVFSL